MKFLVIQLFVLFVMLFWSQSTRGAVVLGVDKVYKQPSNFSQVSKMLLVK